MSWIQLIITTSGSHAEEICDLLTETGAFSVTFQDTEDTPIYEPLPGETPLWGDTDIIALYEDITDLNSLYTELLSFSPFPIPHTMRIEKLEERVWERAWMDNFNSMQFGKRLWVHPSGFSIPDENTVNVLLDPGLAFGTGTHPTTALCLEWLDSLELQGKTVIDFGCGSGILAIAALKLGAKEAIAIDIDPQAILATEENARRNDVSDKLTLYLSDNKPDSLKADVVVANILAGPFGRTCAVTNKTLS